MKQVFTFLMFLVLANFVKAQVAVLPTVSNIVSYSNVATTTIVVTDTIRGGQFFLYTGSDAPDNGMIFTDRLSKKWKRVTTNDKINVCWYGASPSASASTNDAAFDAAEAYITAHPKIFTTLKIPTSAGGWYNKSTTMFYTSGISIEGDEYNGDPTTRISFPGNVTGIAFHQYMFNYNCAMKNLVLRNETTGIRSASDTLKALVDCRSKANFENIRIEWATNIGFNFESDAGGDSTSNPIFGSTAYSQIKNCIVTFAIIGFRTNGSEANYIDFWGCEAGQCSRWGFYDNGLLGNNFWGAKTQANGNNTLSGAGTNVFYGGNYYRATLYHDNGSGIGKRPDLFPLYWQQTGPLASAAWDTTKRYWSGGSRASTHPSGTSQWYGPYDEGDQAGPFYNGRTIQIGGVRGAGGADGIIYRDQSEFQFTSISNFQQLLSVGYNSSLPTIPLQVKANKGETIVASFTSDAVGSIIGLNAKDGSNGYLWALGGKLFIGSFTPPGSQIAITPTSIYDYTGNAVISLGVNGNAFKDIYAKIPNGVGIKSVRVDPSTGKFTYADTIAYSSATYTPTLSNTTNVTSSTPIVCHYTRIGNQVTVTGSLSIVTTLAVATVVGISLPVSSNFTATTDAAGVGNASTAIGTNCVLEANSTTDVTELKFLGSSVGGSGTIFFSFTYTIN